MAKEKQKLIETHPELCIELKNPEDGLKFTFGSDRKLWWICKTCSYEWEAMISNRARLGRGCPKCAGKVVTEDNCLNKTHPDLSHELKIYDDGFKYSSGSGAKLDWVCSKCSYEWKAKIGNRVILGRGCPKCAGKVVTEDNCILSFNPEVCKELKNFSDSLKYSPGSAIKLDWVCSKCSYEWKAFVYSRSSGSGCPNCYGNIRLTNDEFIYRARKIHGDKYDYSKVKYINNNKKVDIMCPKHGLFKKSPAGHLLGAGCGECYDRDHLLGRREEQLLNLLKPHFEDLKSQHNISKYVVDFSILNKNYSHILVLEYDEYDHYKYFNSKISNYSLKNQKLRQEKIIKSLKKKFNKVSFLRVPDCNIKREEIDLEIIYEFTKNYLERFLENDLEERVTDPEFIWNKS